MRIVFTLNYLLACLSVALCGVHPDGASEVSREQDALGNYKFSYAVRDKEGEHFRQEGTDHLGRVIGTYGLTHPDGRQRVVDYVADKNGFRADVRSNEQGVASSETAESSALKLPHDASLSVAATSVENSGTVFGKRLKADASKVFYADTEQKKLPERADNSPVESRPRAYDDYRPQNPVAYYPATSEEIGRPIKVPPYRSVDVPVRSVPSSPAIEPKPSNIYYPPIDPNTALRRPSYFGSRDRTTDRSLYPTTTSRRPFIPPYGGFDDDPVPVNRPPGVSMSTIHGGLGNDDVHTPRTPTPLYGAGRYPSDDSSISRDFIRPRFPPGSHIPNFPQSPERLFPPSTFRDPFFSPPSYNRGPAIPNFVIRAVPIPNGIQAVRVDPETGRIYERLMYPFVLKQDGNPVYDKRILLNNDDVNEDDIIRHAPPSGHIDIPFRNRPPFRHARNRPFDFENFNRTGLFNRSSIVDPRTLGVPTARDLAWVRRQLAFIDGFERSHFPKPTYPRNDIVPNKEFPEFNDFDDSVEDYSREADNPYSRTRNLKEYLPRNSRVDDNLTPEDTNELSVSKREDADSDIKPAETDVKLSVTEKVLKETTSK